MKNFIPVSDEQYEKLERQQEEYENERKRIALKEWYISEKSGVKPRFYNDSFETYIVETEEGKRNLDVVRSFALKKGGSDILLLWGKNGNGKSHLASAIVRENLYAVYVTSAMLCLEFESSSDFNAVKTKLEVINYYSSVPVLVIDEYGRNVSPDLERKVVSLIISNRYDNCLRTCLVTNMDKNDLVRSLGNAIYDRMTEVCTTLEFSGESKRKSLRGNKNGK